MKDTGIRKEGMVIEALPGTMFRVRCADGTEVLVHLSGRMRINRIRILAGDIVVIELPTETSERGRIIYRK